jgi:general secretion pathway protein B
MSYILEALRKADQERMAGSVPDLEADHESPRKTGRYYLWVWVLGIILALNGLLLVVLLLQDAQEQAAPVVAVRPAPERPAVALPAPPPAVVLSRPQSRPPTPAVPVNKPAPAATPTPAPTALPAGQEPVTGMPPAPSPPVPEVSRAVTAQPAAAEEPDAGVPLWEDLSLEFRSGFDMPRLDVHVYDSDPERRFLLIELKKYREGDTLASGAQIEEILPGGIQLYYQGTRFIYRK